MSDIIIREIVESDIEKGFLESLDNLRIASNLNREIAADILKKIISNPDHIINVAEHNGKIVGSTTLLIEQKFIHDGGHVGHIEDVVVSKEYEGRLKKIDERLKKIDDRLKKIDERLKTIDERLMKIEED